MKIVFSKAYTAKVPGHVFRPEKFEAALRMLLKDGAVSKRDVVEPSAPSRADLLLAHSRAWVRKNLEFKFEAGDGAKAELEISRSVVRAHLMNVGGTIEAAFLALELGLGVNCGGGSHHAFRGHGEGFCLLNDIAVAVKKLLKAGLIGRAMVVDLDAHQGNGTASIFRGDKRVFTFSMHGAEIYPVEKERSTLDIGLPRGAGDAVYLAALERELPGAIEKFRPELVVYQAGADVYRGDALGGFKMSRRGIKRRDAFVFRACLGRGIPVALTLGGGYARGTENTAKIHADTVRTAWACLRRAGGWK